MLSKSRLVDPVSGSDQALRIPNFHDVPSWKLMTLASSLPSVLEVGERNQAQLQCRANRLAAIARTELSKDVP